MIRKAAHQWSLQQKSGQSRASHSSGCYHERDRPFWYSSARRSWKLLLLKYVPRFHPVLIMSLRNGEWRDNDVTRDKMGPRRMAERNFECRWNQVTSRAGFYMLSSFLQPFIQTIVSERKENWRGWMLMKGMVQPKKIITILPLFSPLFTHIQYCIQNQFYIYAFGRFFNSKLPTVHSSSTVWKLNTWPL